MSPVKRRNKRRGQASLLREPSRYDPTKTGLDRWFGSGEARVMKLLWQQTEPVTIKQVQEALTGAEQAARAYTTYATLLNRLERKGLLFKRRREDGMFEYETRESRVDWERRRINELLQSLAVQNTWTFDDWVGQYYATEVDSDL